MKGLEPVEAHHLEAQRAQAAAAVSAARASAGETLTEAQAESAAMIAAAEREGETSAELDTNREWTAAHRRARGLVLAAQRDVYDELRRRCVEAIGADRRLPVLESQVADGMRRRLGPGAEVLSEPGGLVANRKSRHVRWSVDEVVQEVLAAMPDEVARLWT